MAAILVSPGVLVNETILELLDKVVEARQTNPARHKHGQH